MLLLILEKKTYLDDTTKNLNKKFTLDKRKTGTDSKNI